MDQEIIDAINSALKPNLQPQTPTKLSPRFKALARECGFVFWQNEPHGPGQVTLAGAVIIPRSLNTIAVSL